MDQANVLELCDQSYAESLRDQARRSGGAVLDEDGLLLVAGAHTLPVLINAAMRTDGSPSLPASEVLARADAFFGPRGRGYSVIARAHVDGDLVSSASDAGYLAFGEPPAMVLDAPPAAAHTTDARVDVVTTGDDVDDFAHVSSVAYATYGMPEDVTPAIFGRPESLLAPHLYAVVARDGDTPVAAALVMLSHGIGGVYWVGTVPEARGRGLAAAVTDVVSRWAFAHGAGLVTLQASTMGEPVYRRMGFRTVTSYPCLVRLEPPRPTS